MSHSTKRSISPRRTILFPPCRRAGPTRSWPNSLTLPPRPAQLAQPVAEPPSDLDGSTDKLLVDAVARTVGAAIRRQQWLLFTEADGAFAPLLLPYTDLPIRAMPTDLRVLCRMLKTLHIETRSSHTVMVWERPGDGSLDAETATWVRDLAAAADAESLALRAQLVAYDHGVRMLATGGRP